MGQRLGARGFVVSYPDPARLDTSDLFRYAKGKGRPKRFPLDLCLRRQLG